MSDKRNMWEMWRQLKSRVAENSTKESNGKKSQLYSSQSCSQCGGQRVYGEVNSGSSGLSVKGLGAGHFSSTPVITAICTDCGLVAFYAQRPKDLILGK